MMLAVDEETHHSQSNVSESSDQVNSLDEELKISFTPWAAEVLQQLRPPKLVTFKESLLKVLKIPALLLIILLEMCVEQLLNSCMVKMDLMGPEISRNTKYWI